MNDNKAQIDLWTTRAGGHWVERQATLDRALGPLGALVLDAAALRPGERVLDVGCGCGDTTLALSGIVGAGGQVTGVDVSAPMLDRARARVAARPEGGAPIELLLADASSSALPHTYDALYSRFGVMFFADPEAAFRHLRGAMRPGGRLAFVCWRARAEQGWVVPIVDAVAPHLPPGAPPDERAPGPFAFADRDRVASLLARAGWSDVGLARHDLELAWTQSDSVEEAVDFFSHIGPASALLAEASEAARGTALAALRALLTAKITPRGCVLPGSVWIVTARA